MKAIAYALLVPALAGCSSLVPWPTESDIDEKLQRHQDVALRQYDHDRAEYYKALVETKSESLESLERLARHADRLEASISALGNYGQDLRDQVAGDRRSLDETDGRLAKLEQWKETNGRVAQEARDDLRKVKRSGP